MLIAGIVLGLGLGLFAGGSLGNLASIRLRRSWLLAFAVVIRYGTEALLQGNVGPAEAVRLPLLTAGFAVLLVALWTNRSYPGLSLAFVGILFNAVVIVVNGGYMPIWEPSLLAAGFQLGDVSTTIHTILPPALDASFLLHLGPFADVIPIPLPFVQNVASVGDAFLTAGLAFFLFAGVVRSPQDADPGGDRGHPPAAGRLDRSERPKSGPARDHGRPRDGPDARAHRERRLDRPLVLGGGPAVAVAGAGLVRDGGAPVGRDGRLAAGGLGVPLPLPRRARRRSSGSASTRTSGSPSTGRSRRCGPAS